MVPPVDVETAERQGRPTGNVADLLTRAAAAHGDRPAVITDKVTYSWSQLNNGAIRGAAALADLGLRPGDRLLTNLHTSAELAVVMFAAARAGLILVPIEPSTADPARVAGRVGAGTVVSPEKVVGGLTVISQESAAAWLDAQGPATETPTAPCGGENIVLLARASRSNRAVMLSHRAILAAVDSIGRAPSLALRADDRVLLVLPLYHLAGFVTAFLPLATVGGAVVIPDVPDFNAGPDQRQEFTATVLAAISQHRVTVLPGAPGLYQLLLRSAGLERALATVRLLTSGASPLDPEDFSALRSRTGSPVWEGYGISEAASAVSTTLMTTQPRPGSVGLPLPGIEVRVEEATDDEESVADGGADTLLDLSNAGEPGPISLRGDHLFSGYWPDGSDGPDADGWFVTGDIGYFDDAGELRLIDRAAEAIVVAGFTVYPREVEVALANHPYVRDVAVIGLPSRAGEDLVAVIIPKSGTTPTAEDLTEYLTDLLPAFKRPVRYFYADLLARTEVGRLDRDSLRREWAAKAGIDLANDARADHRLSVVRPEDLSTDEEVGDAGSAEDANATAEDTAEPAVEVSPEPVPELDLLGTRLPGVAGRARRSAGDTDDDLF